MNADVFRVTAIITVNIMWSVLSNKWIFKIWKNALVKIKKKFGSIPLPVSYTHLTLPTNREV